MGKQLGVRYLFGAEVEPESGRRKEDEVSALEGLASISDELSEELAMALVSLDIMAIAEVVERIGKIDGELGEALAEPAWRYRYDSILDSVAKKGEEAE